MRGGTACCVHVNHVSAAGMFMILQMHGQGRAAWCAWGRARDSWRTVVRVCKHVVSGRIYVKV